MLADVKEKAVCLLVSTYLQRDASVNVNKREQATVIVELKKELEIRKQCAGIFVQIIVKHHL